MSEESPRPKLTPEQVIALFEQQLNKAILQVYLGGFGCVLIGGILCYLFMNTWYGWVILAGCVLIGGLVQRVLVLRVRCPMCGGPALARIHSVMQVGRVRECPYCGVSLRG